jgi:hypothetical protein
MRISKRSQVLEPSPQGVLRVCRRGGALLASSSSCLAVSKAGVTHHDLEGLGGQADGALGAEVLVLGALDELGADLLEGSNLARGQGDAWGGLLVGGLMPWKVRGRVRILCTLGASPNSFSGLL